MNLIFDFDGTLCDSVKPIVSVINKIFSEIGYKKTNIKEVQMKGLKGLIKSRKISPLKVHKLISDYRKRSEEVYEIALPFNGIKDVLKILSRKHNLGILTTNQIKIVEKFLDKHDLNCFNFIYSEINVFGKHKGLKKIISERDLNTTETYYVGDETRDVEAAKKTKVKTIAVSWGAESKELLMKSSPDIVISEPTELLKIWK